LWVNTFRIVAILQTFKLCFRQAIVSLGVTDLPSFDRKDVKSGIFVDGREDVVEYRKPFLAVPFGRGKSLSQGHGKRTFL
jgi:hypothetical protein